ncbi:MAG: hypothetical protein KME16_04740 [Scytolyngbya sp. HA4215-MV1]|nr:hypothetical protein [Scytolyngbya sp. HA4215-MV1]
MRHSNSVWQVRFSADGQTLVSCSFDQTIKHWSLETRSCQSTLRVQHPYEGMNISDTIGLNEAQRVTLRALGAVGNE